MNCGSTASRLIPAISTQVESSDNALAAGESYFFVTAPIGPKPTRLWVLGDPGTANGNQRAVRDAYYGFNGSRYTDLWLLLGDKRIWQWQG